MAIFQDLPESLVCFILSKLSLKDAVRCNLISRRWKRLSTSLSHIKFNSVFFNDIPSSTRKTEQIMDSILMFHFSPLESFEFYNIRCHQTKKIWQWIRWASLRRVSQITLSALCNEHSVDIEDSLESDLFEHTVELPTYLFSCDCLTYLFLENFEVTKIPIDFGGFKYLITCILETVHLDDYLLEDLVGACPAIETLKILFCHGLENLKINSRNLSSLTVESQYLTSCTITTECSQLMSVNIRGCDIDEFNTPEQLTWRKFTLLAANLGCSFCAFNFLGKIPNIEELCIESDYFKDVINKDASGLTLPLTQLKKVEVNISDVNENAKALLSCILRSSPVLEILSLTADRSFEPTLKVQFVNQLLGLQRSSADIRISFRQKYPFLPPIS